VNSEIIKQVASSCSIFIQLKNVLHLTQIDSIVPLQWTSIADLSENVYALLTVHRERRVKSEREKPTRSN